MAREDTGGDAGKEHRTSRRSVLKAAGVTTLALASGSAVAAPSSGPRTAASTVVDLGTEGLTDGDTIDQYLADHFEDGVEVHVPAGTYQYTGTGLGGEYTDAAVVGSPDGVEFQRPSDGDTPTITASSGMVRIENISLTGASGASQWQVGATSGASMQLVNVNFPDGSTAESESAGVAVHPDHAGLLWAKRCHFAKFTTAALDATAPAGADGGRVVVEDSTFVNTGGSAVRFAPDNSVLRGCYFEASEAVGADGDQQRAIQLPVAGGGLTIEDCDFNWAGPGTSVVDFAAGGDGGGGTLRDLRVGYGDQETLFTTAWDIEAGWTGENINVSEA